MRVLGQVIAYAIFAAATGLFSVWPSYRLLGSDQAMISLSFSHAALRVGECRKLTQAELDELPPNMRKPADCPRERYPLSVRLSIDGRIAYDRLHEPSGLWKDGKASIYSRFPVDAGRHSITIGMNESGGTEFDYDLEANLAVAAGQNIVLSFDGAIGEFIIIGERQ